MNISNLRDNAEVIFFLLHAVTEAMTKPILYINVKNYFESSLVVWAGRKANDIMPGNNDDYGDTAKMIFADFDMSFSPYTKL
jgi:hypothetical protein